MQLRSLIVTVFAACFLVVGEPANAESPAAAYRVLQGTGACLACGAQSYVVIDSHDTLEALYTELKERCHGSEAPDTWRQTFRLPRQPASRLLSVNRPLIASTSHREASSTRAETSYRCRCHNRSAES